MAANLPTKLIICCDGTWFSADGGAQKNGNLTNIYRLYASVKRGECIDRRGRHYLQEKHYVPGIGSEDNLTQLSKGYSGMFGLDALDQIRTIYEECCRLTGPEDEVWLYGFSRGAYVVRAVAGLLHYMRALKSATTAAFDDDYHEALKVYQKMVKKDELPDQGPIRFTENGRIHHFFEEKTRPPPKIQFLGVFDTVRRVKDNDQFDIDWNDSIQHTRAAVALNEDRQTRTPKLIFPTLAKESLHRMEKSFIHAWFIGTHIDMGGSAANDGLALYPLQWILLESQRLGLKLHFEENNDGFDGRAPLDSPLGVVGLDSTHTHHKWSCKTENGVTIEMRDIRHRHNREGYEIQLHRVYGMKKSMKWRRPFSENNLEGYCNFAPQGTIIHPSVYMIMDRYSVSKKLPFDTELRAWRARMLGLVKGVDTEEQGFWNDGQLDADDSGPMRILVCGNSGVGKSTLINQVFGVNHATNVSNDTAGQHNVWKEVTWKDRPDLVLHDSEGFETGGDKEFNVVEEFLIEKSREDDMMKRLHAVWFCIEATSCRMIQESARKMFKLMSRYGNDLAFIVVATKKDDLVAIEEARSLNRLRSQGRLVDDEARAQAEQDAQEILKDRYELLVQGIRKETDRYHAVIMTSMFDEASITALNEETLELIKSDTGRLKYVRAQTRNLKLKRDLAIAKTMSLYRNIITSAALTGGVPGGPTTNRSVAVFKVCETVLSCFMIPIKDVSIQTVLDIASVNVPADIGKMILTTITEGINALGVLGTIAAGGMPVFLASTVLNAPMVPVLNARVFLHLACDLILIFSRAFQAVSISCYTQPQKTQLEAAARHYRQYSKAVHADVKKMAPSTIFGVFKVENIRAGVEQVLQEWTPTVIEGAEKRPGGTVRAEYRPTIKSGGSGLSGKGTESRRNLTMDESDTDSIDPK